VPQLILVILYIEYLSMLIGVGILSTAGVGSVGYPYISYFLLWIAVPKFLVAMLLLLEFVRRRYYESPNDMFTALPSGRAVSVRDELTKLVREHANGCTKTVSAEAGPGSHPTPYAKDASRRRASQRAKGARVARLSKAGERAQKRHSYTKLTGLSVEGGGELCDHARFSIEAKQLVTGKPRDAALGVNFYMKVDRYTFAMPSYAGGIDAIVREFNMHGSDTDRECLHYCIDARAGSSSLTFENGGLRRDCGPDGQVLPERLTAAGLGMTLDDFCSHEAAITAGLQPPHVLALRLYTTAAFRSLNAPLRDTSNNRKPHCFPVTVNFIREAISQLRAVDAEGESAARSVDLWRGLKNVEMAADFLLAGGTEVRPSRGSP